MIRKSFRPKTCINCGKAKGLNSYSPAHSHFCVDGYLPICNECLDQEMADMKGEWAYMDYVCQWADVPFVPEQFTKIYSSVPTKAVSTYLKYFSTAEYSRIHWKDYQDRWEQAIKENNEKILHPVFNQQELKELQMEWGAHYTPEELYQLNKFFQDLKTAFGISDVATERDAKTLAKLSIEIDRNIAEGAQGVEKLVTAYNKVKDSGGFSSDRSSDSNEFSSVSELMFYLERTGWTEKFHNDEVQDVVDATIRNMTGNVTRLYANEASIQDQIEARLEAKKRIDALEKQSFDSEVDLDIYENQAYTELADEEEKEEIDMGD